MRHLTQHIRNNAVAYVALFFAIGGGGGYALAATSSHTIHACIVKKTGELLVKSHCNRAEKAVSWNQVGRTGATGAVGATGPAGAAPYTAHGEVSGSTGGAGPSSGFTVAPVSTGVVSVTLTSCPSSDFNASLVVTPIGPNSSAVATVDHPNGAQQNVFDVTETSGGSPVANDAFTLLGEC